MTAIAIILAIGIIILGYVAYLLNKRVALLLGRLQETIPFLKKAGLDFDAMQPFLKPLEWVVVKEGGNNQEGNVGNLGLCPCQKEYTVNTKQTAHRQMPNAGQIANCVNNPPPADPAEWKCPDDCVQVMTHIWHGWTIVRNRRTGQFKLNCHTFAQYHCKKPGDPAIDQEPEDGPPSPDVET